MEVVIENKVRRQRCVLTVYVDVMSNFIYRKKTQRICKITSKEVKILIKNIATRKEVRYEEIELSSPTNSGR